MTLALRRCFILFTDGVLRAKKTSCKSFLTFVSSSVFAAICMPRKQLRKVLSVEFFSFPGMSIKCVPSRKLLKRKATRQLVWGSGKNSMNHTVMVFSGGDGCWNGPDRSLKVKLRCGLTNEVTDVDKPSHCEYMVLLSTPAVCSDDRRKELQDKLDAMNFDEL